MEASHKYTAKVALTMYFCKIANTAAEFDAIAALNYETFVEEIPQHESNTTRRLIDRFHHENTYVVIYKEQHLIGMLAFRDNRPFSVDGKVGVPVEQLLQDYDTSKLCEIRLLAIQKAFRNGRVFQKLAQAIYTYVYERGYSGAVISGVTREEKLYRRIGFEAFAAVTGTAEAAFIPMILTRANCLRIQQQIRLEPHNFYPGPVAQTELTHTTMSHRSVAFQELYAQMKQRLLTLTSMRDVTTSVGSGTLANDVMLGQIRATFGERRGLVLANGEFGERLQRQAAQWQLNFETYDVPWGEAFDSGAVRQLIAQQHYAWLVFVHGETSTGVFNGALIDALADVDVAICVDGISSIGATPTNLVRCMMATAVSGKAIGALSGLAFVFTNEHFTENAAPFYSNLAYYQQQALPFTLPAYLVANTVRALQQYPARFELLQHRFNRLAQSSLAKYRFSAAPGYAMIASFQLPEELCAIARLNSLLLHDESHYLKQRQLAQISVIGPQFDEAFVALQKLVAWYEKL